MRYVIITGSAADIRREIRGLLGRSAARLVRSYIVGGRIEVIKSFCYYTDEYELVVVGGTAVVRFS